LQPEGIVETLDICLLQQPGKQINVPETQKLQFLSSTFLMAENEKMPEVIQHLCNSVLQSDMASFKAANPGCIFEDFIRWHSPKDWIEKDKHSFLSVRMSQPNSKWKVLWEQAAAIPLKHQKPLFDPLKEGESILHYLETMKPSEVLSQLFLISYSASFNLLKLAGKKFRSLSKQFECLAKISDNYLHLDDFMSLSCTNIVRNESVDTKIILKALIDCLSVVENNVSSAHAIMLRLKGLPDESFTVSLVNQMLEHVFTNSKDADHGLTMSQEEARIFGDCVLQHESSSQVALDGPIQLEHVIELRKNDCIHGPPEHRLFVLRLRRELRVATTITSSSSS